MGISKSLWLILIDEVLGWMAWRLSMCLSQVETRFEKGVGLCSARIIPC